MLFIKFALNFIDIAVFLCYNLPTYLGYHLLEIILISL